MTVVALDSDSIKWLESRFKHNVKFGEPMSRHTSLRVGGPAEAFATPENVEDLEALVKWSWDRGLSYLIIGKGTNLLVKDNGIHGIVIVVTKCLEKIDQTDTLDHFTAAFVFETVLGPEVDDFLGEFGQGLVIVFIFQLHEGHNDGTHQVADLERAFATHQDGYTLVIAGRQCLWHHVQAMHAAHAVAIVDAERIIIVQ